MAEQTRSQQTRKAGNEGSGSQPTLNSGEASTAAPAGANRISWPTTATPKFARKKQLMSLRLDPDIIEWFKGQGSGYQTRMNSVLRAYANARDDTGSK